MAECLSSGRSAMSTKGPRSSKILTLDSLLASPPCWGNDDRESGGSLACSFWACMEEKGSCVPWKVLA